MKKHPSFVIRKIRNGKIKWNHRYWETHGDVSHIEGKKLVFGTYAPEYNLLSLWGTIEASKHPSFDDKKGEKLWLEICKIMGEEPKENGLNIRGGHYLIQQINNGEKWIAWKDRGIGWWHPI